ncbi:MAG: SDR family oxidoreductase [Planctomycetota bacterium]|nr:SDR family oxidoreductase [Planctomycetota bacterium]
MNPVEVAYKMTKPLERSVTDMTDERKKPVLVTGATGYIGGRLVPRLLKAGERVRCFVRSPKKLANRPWFGHPALEIVEGDVANSEALTAALKGCDVAYYLVHSMVSSGPSYRLRDRELATLFAKASADAEIERIIYLGGLGETGPELSAHLSSRREVEELLAEGPVPVTVLRAAMIVGSGSASFEILRYLVERLPVMVTPLWVRTPCQPIAVRDVLHYLVACLREPATVGRTLDIGGPDIVTYEDFMRLVTEVRGLRKRLVLPVPLLTPRLSSLWIHLVTPLSHLIARPLAEGLKNPVICREDEAARLMPTKLLGAREAVQEAFAHTERHEVESSWSDSGPMPGDPDWAGGHAYVDEWSITIRAPAKDVFAAVCRIGGGHGYYAADFLWKLRGAMDRLVGGPGLRRGRKDPERVAYGEALDFWRVTLHEPPRRIALRAEMKVPGEALLEFDIDDLKDGQVRLTQRASFLPKGLSGLLYWWAVKPLHGIVFRGMLQGIRTEVEPGHEEQLIGSRGAS